MGTNFYARIIPSKKRKEEIIKVINNNDFEKIKSIVNATYGSIQIDYDTHKLIGGEVHLGKRSGGWKFLWNPNTYVVRHGHMEGKNGDKIYISDPNTLEYLYPLTVKGITDFVMREDIEVYDEYNEKQDKKEFLEMAFSWTTWKGKEAWDSATYHKDYPKDGSFTCRSELIDTLQQEGYTFISDSNSDFYSDGLRFATTTDFS